MKYTGVVKKDDKTKRLIPRLVPGDIAVIDHVDMDRLSAEALIATEVSYVINASASMSGLYPNTGPKMLLEQGITVIDNVGKEVFDALNEYEEITVDGASIYRDNTLVGSGHILEAQFLEQEIERAQHGLDTRLDDFTRNTLSYLKKEREILLSDMWVPTTDVAIQGRHVLVVVRGSDYKEDLRALKGYIREMKPVFIGVDGGADALLEEGIVPDIIVGDMDSVSDKGLTCGAQLIAHAYEDGTCPASQRLESLGLSADVWPLAATSEDLALLLAYHSQAALIVALGTHAHLIEYLDKGRHGMSSTFLVRLKVGEQLVDAKGVNKLYRSAPSAWHVGVVGLAACVTVGVVFAISPQLRSSLGLVWLGIKGMLGIGQ